MNEIKDMKKESEDYKRAMKEFTKDKKDKMLGFENFRWKETHEERNVRKTL